VLHHIQPDHLGSPRKVIQTSNNTAIWDWPILGNAFGEAAPNQDPDGNAVTFTLNLRFPGQYFDAETGLHYNYFRDYEAGTGRYVESDPIGLRGGFSTFGYALQNPIRHFDPVGEATEAALGLCVLGGPVNPLCDGAMVLNACKWIGIGLAAVLISGDTKECGDDDEGCPSSNEGCKRNCDQAYAVQISFCAEINTKRGRQQCYENAMALYAQCLRDCPK